MNAKANNSTCKLSVAIVFLLSLGAVASFQLVCSFRPCSFLIVVFLFCLFELTRIHSGRLAFYVGLTVGVFCYGPQLGFFWSIFGPAAIALWYLLAFWIALFLVLGRLCRLRFGARAAALLIPILWTGLEYFRSELYYLKFSWLNVGYTFSGTPYWWAFRLLGIYGIGFVLMGAIAVLSLLGRKKQIAGGLSLLVVFGLLTDIPAVKSPSIVTPAGNLAVAGVQLEFPNESEVALYLNRLLKNHPEAQLLVLSEYTFNGPVPESLKAWCRKNQRYVLVGAKEEVAKSDYYDTAFVISPTGEIVFRQAKSVPIQFFKDGLPAREQCLWDSPWGKIGVCICYDLSYSRVADALVRMGAQALVVPSMDIVDWGAHQHELHARVAPVRAAEYGIPVVKLGSSGISQLVGATGEVVSSAPFPGEGAEISGMLNLAGPGRLPWDRVIAPACACVTALAAGWLAFTPLWHKLRRTEKSKMT